uniref:Gustatory receptor n=1 Tax=Tetranychus urticae TaxID=32264 RepID=A0A158P5E2_TETUR
MSTKVSSFLSKKKNEVLRNLEKLSSFSFTSPDSNRLDSTVVQFVKRTERLTFVFQLDFNGRNRSNSFEVNTHGYRRYKWMDWFITINFLINLMRFSVLIYGSSDSVSFYLGDTLFHFKDRQVLLMYSTAAFVIMFIFREWILNLNAKGKFEILSAWRVCFNGFNSTNLQMNNLVAKRFRSAIFMYTIISHNVMLSVPLFAVCLFLIPLISNPWTYEIPELAFFGLLWSIPTIFLFTFLLNAVIGFAWYNVCSIYFDLFRLYDLVHSADDLNHWPVNEKQVRSFCLVIIRHLNNFEAISHKFRYLQLSYFIIFAVAADFDLFLGMIVKIYNEFFANLFTILGFFSLITLGTFGLIFGNFISQLDKLTMKLHQLTTKSKFSMSTSNKILEIMDRATGPYNGVKIGDFVTLEKRFFVSFILENISILMLFICNIGPLIH